MASDTPINIVTATGSVTIARERGVIVQNVGTAVCGIHVGDTQPASLDACEIVLAAASAVDKADGGIVTDFHPRGKLWIYVAASGTPKVKVSPQL